MRLSAFATRVLTGETLADKLLQADVTLDDAAPRAVDRPGRPAHLGLAPKGAHAPLPRRGQLDRPEARGALLHSFANHELLATELMAQALLAFPEAPAGFRLGLLAVLRDEQRHLQLYLDRLDALGVPFGSHPLSSFFWDTCADAPTPLDFVCRLSLVFEQANLDFARTFGAWFREAGDADSAAVLEQVYADEIRHVRHGLGWLRRWRDPAWTDWDAWVARLQRPLGPSRAKGLGFHAPSRAAVGFDPDFTARLARWRRSRGRPPTVWLSNPLCEVEWLGAPPARLQALADDLALLPVALARADDVVLAPHAPSPTWLDALVAAGFPVPEVHAGPVSALPHPVVSALRPWGWSPAAHAHLSPLVARAQEAPPAPSRAAFSKAWSHPVRVSALDDARADLPDALVSAGALGAVATTRRDVLRLVRGPVVLKAPWGTSGRGALRLDGPPDDRALRWVDRTLGAQGAVVVEPWLDRRLDLSLHLDLTDAGCAVVGWTRFFTDRTGRFRAAAVDGLRSPLPPALRRLLVGDGRDPGRMDRLGRLLADALAPALRAEGVRGPVGVDALVAQTPDGPRLHPLVEINPRWTLGRVALSLAGRVRAGCPARLALATARELGEGPIRQSWPAWAARHPPRLTAGRLTDGLVALTDPAHATGRLAVLAVGAAVAPLHAAIRATGPGPQ